MGTCSVRYACMACPQRSKPVLELSRYLYRHEGHGYFRYRWGDQASPPAFMCHALRESAPSGARTGLGGTETLFPEYTRHLDALRGLVFKHERSGAMKKQLKLATPKPTPTPKREGVS